MEILGFVCEHREQKDSFTDICLSFAGHECISTLCALKCCINGTAMSAMCALVAKAFAFITVILLPTLKCVRCMQQQKLVVLAFNRCLCYFVFFFLLFAWPVKHFRHFLLCLIAAEKAKTNTKIDKVSHSR